MKAIVNANIILSESIIFDGVILVNGDKIEDFGEKGKITIPYGVELIDARGQYAAPGFIDIHTHAGGGIWFHEDPMGAAAHHLKHGTTSLLPALYFNLTLEEYLNAIKKIRHASKKAYGKVIDGIYMEGPYLNPKFGAEVNNNKWANSIERDKYIAIIKEAGSFASIWCIAPEREGIEGFVEDVKKENPSSILSVAHSEATPYQVEKYIPLGLKLGTHHTNATGDLSKYPECRGVCVDEAVNSNDEIFAELICDSKGIHVDPYMLRLVRKIKGRNKIILVSDCCVFDGPIPPGYDGVTDLNFDFEGQIAGSKLTLDVACRNMMKHTGAGLCDVFHYASYNPSRLLGRQDIGSIRKGGKANIVIVDHLVNVQDVMLEGELVKLKQNQ